MQLEPQVKIELQRLISDLHIFGEALDRIDYIYDKELFFEKMEDLWDYIKKYANDEVINIFLHTDEFITFRKKLGRFQEYYERAMEMGEAMVINANILQNDPEKLLNFAKNNFVVDNYKMVQRELDLFENKNPKQLVMVGCGPLPETILFIADNTNIPEIVGIDCNQEAISMAGDVVKAMGHKDRVKLVYSYAEEYDFKDADIIHIANATHNKGIVLDKVAKTAKKNVEIIVRNPSMLSNLMYHKTSNIPENLIQLESIKGDTSFLHTPCLLQKINY